MSDETTSGPQREQIEAAAEAFDEYLKRAKESLDIERERNALQGKFVQSIQDARDAEEIRLRDLNASLKRLLTASDGTSRYCSQRYEWRLEKFSRQSSTRNNSVRRSRDTNRWFVW